MAGDTFLPALSDIVYLDHHASTPLHPTVLEAMQPWFTDRFGNPSNHLHSYGRLAREGVEQARGQVASLLHCATREIYFTSGATEANNLALLGTLADAPHTKTLVISNLEHESVSGPAEHLEREGVTVIRIQSDEVGRVQPDQLERILLQNTAALVSIITIQGEIGTVNHIPELARIAHKYGALFHTDAAQAVGKIPVNVRGWDVDFLTLAGHKMYGPKGIGVLFKREGIELQPVMYGAGHESGLRPGTENVAAIVGLGAACDLAEQDLNDEARRQTALRDYMWESLEKGITGIRFNGPRNHRHPGNLHFSLPDLNSIRLLEHLPGYALSVGSACHSAHPAENPLVQSLGIPKRYARGSVRIGLGRTNTRAQIEGFLEDFIATYYEVKEHA